MILPLIAGGISKAIGKGIDKLNIMSDPVVKQFTTTSNYKGPKTGTISLDDFNNATANESAVDAHNAYIELKNQGVEVPGYEEWHNNALQTLIDAKQEQLYNRRVQEINTKQTTIPEEPKVEEGFLEATGKNIVGGVVSTGKGLWEGGQSVTKGLMGLGEKGALTTANYLRGLMGKEPLKQEELSQEGSMQPTTAGQDVLNLGEGSLSSSFYAIAPYMTTALNFASQTDLGEKALGTAGNVIGWAGSIANKIPGLKQYRESLPEGDKERLDALVGNTLLLGLGKKPIKKLDSMISKPIETVANIKKGVQGKIGETASKLEVSTLLNPADLKNAAERLSKLEGKTPEMTDVGKWLLERNLKGTRQEIIDKIGTEIENTKTQAKEYLASNPKTFQGYAPVENLKQALNEKLQTYMESGKPTAGNEGIVSEIQGFINNPRPTSVDVNNARNILGDGLFTKQGTAKELASKQGWQNIWKDTSKLLEKENPGFRKLNKDTEVGIALQKGINKTEARAQAKEILGYMGFGGVAGGTVGLAGGDILKALQNIVVGGVLGAVGGKVLGKLRSTEVKTSTANLLNKLTPEQKTALKDLSEGRPITPEMIGDIKNNILQAEAFKGPKTRTTTSNVLEMPTNKKFMMGGDVKGIDKGLIEEAKKYKSAEEFVKAQGEPVLHGTPNKFDEFKKEYIGKQTDPGIIGKGFYFTNNRKFASDYAGKNGNVMNVYIDNNSNLFNLGKLKTLKQASDMLGMKESNFYQARDGKIIPKNFKTSEVFGKKLKELGYDGAYFDRYTGSKEIVIFEPKNIKTEAQLKQIYEQANK